MLNAPPAESRVAGFSIEVKAHDANLASGNGDHGSHLLEDGFLHLAITGDGSNPFWPEKVERTVLIARLKNRDNAPAVRSEYEIFLMKSGSEVTSIRLEETALKGAKHGVWLLVDGASSNTSQDSELIFGIMIQSTADVFHGAHAVH